MLNNMKMNCSWLLALCITFMLSACDDTASRLPKELKLTKPSHRLDSPSHTFGPGGSDHSIIIYELPQSVIDEINQSGLQFLNQLPSTVNYKIRKPFIDAPLEVHWKPFKIWQKTPVEVNDKWIRKSWIVGFSPVPTLNQCLAEKEGSEFLQSIPPDTRALIDRLIQSNGNFYAYGGYHDNSILILSPIDKKALYLFRY